MPGAIGALVTKVLVAVGVNAAASAFIGNVVGVVLLSTITSKLFGPRIPEGPGFSGLQTTTRSALEYRKIIYGQAIVSGPVAYPNMSGTNNSDYWVQVLMLHGRSEDLVSVWIDGHEIPKADIAWTAGSGSSDGTGTGNVSTARFVGENSATAVRVYYYLGYEDQPVNGDLDTAFDDITTNHRCRGISHVIFRMIYSEDTVKVWESGVPQQFRAVWKGRLLYDPRKDTAKGGTGTHDFDDDSTWEHSDNPALCVADYLTQIMGVDEDSIDWSSVADAADDCDETVAIPTSDTEKRFTCNGALSLGNSHRDNLDAILSSMDGKLTYSGGKWKVRASMWEAASVSFDEDDHAGDMSVRGSAPKAERWNTVRGYYCDPERLYEFVEFEPVTSSTYVTRDGGEVIERELGLPMTDSETMAQRLAWRVLHQGNNQIIASPTFNFAGRKATVGDVASLDDSELSWSDKTFRVINWARNDDASTTLVLREDHESDYDDPDEEEYQSKTTPSITTPDPSVPAPSSLTATAIPVGIRIDWTNPAERLFRTIEVWASTDDQWSNAVLIAEVTANSYTIVRDAGEQRWFWVRAKRTNGLVSKRAPDSDTSTVTATSGQITDDIVVDEPADGDIDYTGGTQPRVEIAGINGNVSFTATASNSKAIISWSAQAQISNTTSGVAVGEASISILVKVNSVDVYESSLILEGYDDSGTQWGLLSGTRSFSVPKGQEIEAFLTVGREFSTSGTSPAQTITWRAAVLTLLPVNA